VHLFDERLYYFFMRVVVALYILIQLFAYVLIFNVHLFFGFPPRVRIHPLLNDARLIAGRHVNELFHVGIVFVFDPFIGLHVHGFALQVRAMNRPLVHIHPLQIVHDDGAHAFHNSLCLRVFQVLQRDFQGFDKIAQLDGVLALVVQKHVQVELRVVRGDNVAVPNFGRHLLNGLNELLILLRHLAHHILILHHHFMAFVKHGVPIVQQHLHHGFQIHELFVLTSNFLGLFGHARNFIFHHSQRHGSVRCRRPGLQCIAGRGCNHFACLPVIEERRPQHKRFATCTRVCLRPRLFHVDLVLVRFTVLGHVAFSCARIITHIAHQSL